MKPSKSTTNKLDFIEACLGWQEQRIWKQWECTQSEAPGRTDITRHSHFRRLGAQVTCTDQAKIIPVLEAVTGISLMVGCG